jgi:hypothetical protein
VRRLAPDGLYAWRQVVERGYEGCVAKDEASGYEGGPTNGGLRVKVPGATEADDRWRRVKTPASYGAVQGASGNAPRTISRSFGRPACAGLRRTHPSRTPTSVLERAESPSRHSTSAGRT